MALLIVGVASFGLLPVQPSGAQESPAPKPAERPSRVYADAFLTWIYKTPQRDVTPIGYIRGGDSIRLRAHEGTPAGVRLKRGCGRGWYAVEPAGFVCLDHTASLSKTRYSQSMATLEPHEGPHPFDFALSMGSPSYRRVPLPAEWEKKERVFGDAKPRPLPAHWQGHEQLVTDAEVAPGRIPTFLESGGSVSREQETRLVRRDVPFGSMLAITGSFESNGRRFVQSADGTIVPSDRLRMFRRSTFQGVALAEPGDNGPSLPLAWTRTKTRLYQIKSSPACAIDGSGTSAAEELEPLGPPGRLGRRPAQLKLDCLIKMDAWRDPRHVTALTGRVVDVAGTRFAEVGQGPSSESSWLPTRYLFVAEKREKMGATGSETKWIHFAIGQGTLVTYRGETPTFATLASPGIGGVPAPGADPLSTRTTPVGTYRIQFKHRTDDMSPEQTEDRSYWIADVPFAMYFKQPFAIHVAYWHESFGEPMSGGCINVSPRDGERLFSFADPSLPPHWYGVGASKELGYGTYVVIDR